MENQNLQPLLLRVTEAAVLLGVCRTSLYEMVRKGELPAVRMGSGRSIRIPRKWLEKYVDQLTQEAAEA